ncbi:hypothetical protein CPB83DRAFT_897059 [Crepidotus variabilis]|uniref:DUF7330 domain-containing protein n=1 Tax=Crepidotus variabilis TaxID=179855 RepID=A0A9P6EAP6_9AGAR|nr:hypothetical protein CPB83DRAFT_897059 [Crepidotus variabilis]
MTADSSNPSRKTTANEARRQKILASLRLPAGVKRCNFLLVNPCLAVNLKGVWVVDPSMQTFKDQFPAFMNSKGKTPSKDRKNLELETTHAIFADVFVLPTTPYKQVLSEKEQEAEESQRCTSISLKSSRNIQFRLHDASSEIKNEDRSPIVVAAAAENGRLRINLPRSFCGPLHLQCTGRVWYSAAVKAQITPLAEVDGHHLSFLGDFKPDLWYGWEEWKGDSFEGFAGRGDAVDVYFDTEDYIPNTDSNLNTRLPWVWAMHTLGLKN